MDFTRKPFLAIASSMLRGSPVSIGTAAARGDDKQNLARTSQKLISHLKRKEHLGSYFTGEVKHAGNANRRGRSPGPFSTKIDSQARVMAESKSHKRSTTTAANMKAIRQILYADMAAAVDKHYDFETILGDLDDITQEENYLFACDPNEYKMYTAYYNVASAVTTKIMKLLFYVAWEGKTMPAPSDSATAAAPQPPSDARLQALQHAYTAIFKNGSPPVTPSDSITVSAEQIVRMLDATKYEERAKDVLLALDTMMQSSACGITEERHSENNCRKLIDEIKITLNKELSNNERHVNSFTSAMTKYCEPKAGVGAEYDAEKSATLFTVIKQFVEKTNFSMTRANDSRDLLSYTVHAGYPGFTKEFFDDIYNKNNKSSYAYVKAKSSRFLDQVKIEIDQNNQVREMEVPACFIYKISTERPLEVSEAKLESAMRVVQHSWGFDQVSIEDMRDAMHKIHEEIMINRVSSNVIMWEKLEEVAEQSKDALLRRTAWNALMEQRLLADRRIWDVVHKKLAHLTPSDGSTDATTLKATSNGNLSKHELIQNLAEVAECIAKEQTSSDESFTEHKHHDILLTIADHVIQSGDYKLSSINWVSDEFIKNYGKFDLQSLAVDDEEHTNQATLYQCLDANIDYYVLDRPDNQDWPDDVLGHKATLQTVAINKLSVVDDAEVIKRSVEEGVAEEGPDGSVAGAEADVNNIFPLKLNKEGTCFMRGKWVASGEAPKSRDALVSVKLENDTVQKIAVKDLRKAKKNFNIGNIVDDNMPLNVVKARFCRFCIQVFNRVLSVYLCWYHSKLNTISEKKMADAYIIVAAVFAVVAERISFEAKKVAAESSKDQISSSEKIASLRHLLSVFQLRKNSNKMDILRKNIMQLLGEARDDACKVPVEAMLDVKDTRKVAPAEEDRSRPCIE